MANRRNQAIVEDCLKAIFTVGEWDARARTITEIALQMGASTSATSSLVRRLSESGLLSHERYGDVALTEEGLATALRMVRRHRLIETFLVEVLGYGWDEVHDEAESLEHIVSERMLTRIDALLGQPWRDPHGDAIPTPDHAIHLAPARPLAALEIDETGYVARILDESSEMLRWFDEHGLALDTEVRVVETSSFSGSTVVELTNRPSPEAGAEGPRQVHVGPQAVGALWVAADLPWPEANAEGCHYADCHHPA